MSTVKIEFESEDNAVVVAIAAMANSLLGKTTEEVKKMEVVEAEEVKPTKTPTPRPSRAKAKPEPAPEPGEEETDEDAPEAEEEQAEDEQAEEIEADDIRALQATKVDKHRETIKAQLKKLGATGIKDLDPDHYRAYYDFLGKLK